MPQRWGIWYAVDGDLRFASHHDMMRMLGRLTARANLPVRFSQGFNPRPVLSLAWPRPVGVATDCDLLVLSLDVPEGDGVRPEDVLAALAPLAPPGLRFLRAERLAGKSAPQPRRFEYRRAVSDELAGAIRRRLDELAGRQNWPVERTEGPARRGEAPRRESLDLRPLVEDVRVEAGVLRWTQVPSGPKWARPAEVLRLLGMDDPADLATVRRTKVESKE